MIVEKPIRSIVKSFSWRIIATLDTILITWLVTGKIGVALSVGGIEFFTKMLIYYIHERCWSKSKFGKKEVKPPEYNI